MDFIAQKTGFGRPRKYGEITTPIWVTCPLSIKEKAHRYYPNLSLSAFFVMAAQDKLAEFNSDSLEVLKPELDSAKAQFDAINEKVLAIQAGLAKKLAEEQKAIADKEKFAAESIARSDKLQKLRRAYEFYSPELCKKAHDNAVSESKARFGEKWASLSPSLRLKAIRDREAELLREYMPEISSKDGD